MDGTYQARCLRLGEEACLIANPAGLVRSLSEAPRPVPARNEFRLRKAQGCLARHSKRARQVPIQPRHPI